MRWLSILFLVAAAQAQAAVELHLHFGALQKMLASQVFTEEGRKYVKGSAQNRCSFAYLENPRIGTELGRLRILARFSGRSALDFLGRCMGMGDSFDVVILATPYYRKGSVALKDVAVNTVGKETYYKSKVRGAMTTSLQRDFAYPLEGETKKILETATLGPNYKQEVDGFDVTAIRVTDSALVLTLEFRLAVK